jgi:hypothetical protein
MADRISAYLSIMTRLRNFIIASCLIAFCIIVSSCSVSTSDDGGDSAVDQSAAESPDSGQAFEQYAKRRMKQPRPAEAEPTYVDRPLKKPYPVQDGYEPLKEQMQK